MIPFISFEFNSAIEASSFFIGLADGAANLEGIVRLNFLDGPQTISLDHVRLTNRSSTSFFANKAGIFSFGCSIKGTPTTLEFSPRATVSIGPSNTFDRSVDSLEMENFLAIRPAFLHEKDSSGIVSADERIVLVHAERYALAMQLRRTEIALAKLSPRRIWIDLELLRLDGVLYPLIVYSPYAPTRDETKKDSGDHDKTTPPEIHRRGLRLVKSE